MPNRGIWEQEEGVGRGASGRSHPTPPQGQHPGPGVTWQHTKKMKRVMAVHSTFSLNWICRQKERVSTPQPARKDGTKQSSASLHREIRLLGRAQRRAEALAHQLGLSPQQTPLPPKEKATP